VRNKPINEGEGGTKLPEYMGLFIKDVRSQGVKKLSSVDNFRTRGVLQIRTSALFVAKNLGFFKIMKYRTDKGGWASVDIFGQWKGVNFSRFSADVFYGI